MELSKNELQNLSVNHLIDLLLAKASELLKAADESNLEVVNSITRELSEIHQIIKAKRSA